MPALILALMVVTFAVIVAGMLIVPAPPEPPAPLPVYTGPERRQTVHVRPGKVARPRDVYDHLDDDRDIA